jgi:hypothetical protein
LDLTRDCYEKFPIKVQYKVRGRPVSLRRGIKTAGSAFCFCRSPTTFRSSPVYYVTCMPFDLI